MPKSPEGERGQETEERVERVKAETESGIFQGESSRMMSESEMRETMKLKLPHLEEISEVELQPQKNVHDGTMRLILKLKRGESVENDGGDDMQAVDSYTISFDEGKIGLSRSVWRPAGNEQYALSEEGLGEISSKDLRATLRSAKPERK